MDNPLRRSAKSRAAVEMSVKLLAESVAAGSPAAADAAAGTPAAGAFPSMRHALGSAARKTRAAFASVGVAGAETREDAASKGVVRSLPSATSRLFERGGSRGVRGSPSGSPADSPAGSPLQSRDQLLLRAKSVDPKCAPPGAIASPLPQSQLALGALLSKYAEASSAGGAQAPALVAEDPKP